MKKLIFALILFMAACAPATPAAGVYLPVSQPTADNAYIAPSYPTSQADVTAPNQSSNGINVRVDRAWREGKELKANICFSLPDNSDWSIWSANLSYGGNVLNEYSTTLFSLNPGAERCDTLIFSVPPDADLSNSIITIDSIGTTPRDDEYCTVYMPKIQQAMNERGNGILLDCVDNNGTMAMQIVGIPPTMTQEQAEQLVYSDEFFTVKGPWVFTFSVQ